MEFFRSLSGFAGTVFICVGLFAPVLHLTGLILGVIGAFSKETKKTFSIAGIILNLLFGLIGIGIIFLLFLIFQIRLLRLALNNNESDYAEI